MSSDYSDDVYEPASINGSSGKSYSSSKGSGNGSDPYGGENERKDDLHVQSVGVIYMKAELGDNASHFSTNDSRPKLPCTSMSFSLGINAIPQATVYMSIGSSILTGESSSKVRKLLAALIGQSKDGADKRGTRLIRCALFEEATGKYGFKKDKKIFDGYIVNGGPMYAARTDASQMQVMFSCCGKAAALMAAPCAAYVEAYMGAVIQRYRMANPTGKSEQEQGQEQGDWYIGMKADAQQLMQDKVFTSESAANIAMKVALCVGAARLSTAWIREKDDQVEPDYTVLDVLGGTTELKTNARWNNGIPEKADYNYTFQLLTIFLERMSRSSIWETIVSTLASDQFALNIIPRWHCDIYEDFKMDICPSVAWNPGRTVIYLTAADVTMFRMDHNALESLNTPDIIFVNFNEINPYLAGAAGLAVGPLGVAAYDEELEKDLRDMVKGQNLHELNERTTRYRVKEMVGPAWLTCVATDGDAVVNNEEDLKTLGTQHTPATSSAETGGIADSTTQPAFSKEDEGVTVNNAANTMARTLFLHYFMTGDVAVVDLLPDCRFGLRKNYCLENSLGETIDLDFSDASSGVGLRKFHVRGVLTGINYSYASGQASSSKYQIMLSRVRLVDDEVQVPEEECPLYTSDDLIKDRYDG